MTKTRLSAVALGALLLAGCAMPALTVVPAPGTGTTTGTTKPGATLTDPKTGKPIPNQPVEPLNGIAFKPLSPANAQFVGNGGNMVSAGGLNGTAGATAPSAAGAPAPAMAAESASGDANFSAPSSAGTVPSAGGGMALGMNAKGPMPSPGGAGGAFSGNVWSNYGFGYYFGGGGNMGDQMALVSLQEAETKGSTGSFQEIVAGIAAPVVKPWAPDARLVESGSVLTNDGALFVDTPQPGMGGGMDAKMSMMPMPGPGYPGSYDGSGAWRLVYASSERREVLQFTVKADKTSIIRMRWAPLDLAPERVLTDSASAVRSVVKAVTDKTFQGDEEKTGKDYFLGFAFQQPQTGQWDGDYQKTEVLYEVPKDARWNVTLTQVMGKLVWDLNWNAPWNQPMIAGTSAGMAVAMPMPMIEPAMDMERPTSISARPECAPGFRAEPQSYINYWGQAMVDAETGTVIRFSRPTKTTYNNQQVDFGCAVPPMNAEKPPVAVEPPSAGDPVEKKQ